MFKEELEGILESISQLEEKDFTVFKEKIETVSEEQLILKLI